MNIFILDKDPTHCDKHVVKMVLETAQILSTVHHQQLPNSDVKRYKPTHVPVGLLRHTHPIYGSLRWGIVYVPSTRPDSVKFMPVSPSFGAYTDPFSLMVKNRIG